MTAEDREEAALICATAASNGPEFDQAYSTTAQALGIEEFDANGQEIPSVTLAFAAWKVTTQCEHPDAEAESLIRNGWSPGQVPA